jgi:hypothetical protein
MRWFFGTLVTLLVLVGVYASSAIVSLNRLVEAARAGDGAEILARTDVPRLKHSLVDQIISSYLIRTGQDPADQAFRADRRENVWSIYC